MSRRSRPAVTLLVLVAVATSFVGTQPRGSMLAADPISRAQSQQEGLQRIIGQQAQQLVALQLAGAQLSISLIGVEAELSSLSVEYERVQGLLEQVKREITAINGQIAELEEQIVELDTQLAAVAADIVAQTAELVAREALLEEHLRGAYEQSQTSVLELLLSADSLESASNQVGYLLSMSEQDKELADEIRGLREGLRERRGLLADGRRAATEARQAADHDRVSLEARQAELLELEEQAAELRLDAEIRRAEQEARLNANFAEQGSLEQAYQQNTAAMEAQQVLVQRFLAEEALRQRQIEEARRRQAAADEAYRRQLAAEARAQQLAAEARARQVLRAPRAAVSVGGFSWPVASYEVTQEFGPTSFTLEPPYTYRGTHYQHFHTGIDLASGCGTPVTASKEGVIIASGQPLHPYDSGHGVIIDHGDGVQTWYWHLQPRVVVSPGAIVTQGQVIGLEGNTGFSTGCHVHFAVNIHGHFENPRSYLP